MRLVTPEGTVWDTPEGSSLARVLIARGAVPADDLDGPDDPDDEDD